MSGWVRIERKVFDDPFFGREPMSEREAWLWMIAQAAWSDTSHRVGSNLYDVPRGSFMVTLRELQSVFMWRSDKRVRSFLARLEEQNMIGRTTVGTRNANKTHVTITKYKEYQNKERTGDAPRTHRGRTKDAVKEQDNNKQDNSSRPAKPAAKRTSLPEGWRLPKEWGEWAMSKGMDEFTIRREAEQFANHHQAKGSKMADWRKAWQTWVGNNRKWEQDRNTLDFRKARAERRRIENMWC